MGYSCSLPCGASLAVLLSVLPGCRVDECGQTIGVPMRRSCPVQLREGLWQVEQNDRSDTCASAQFEVGPDGEFELRSEAAGLVFDPMDGDAPFECSGFDGEFSCSRGEPEPLPGEGLLGQVVVRKTISLQFDVSTVAAGTRASTVECTTPQCDPVHFAELAGVAALPCSVTASVRAEFLED